MKFLMVRKALTLVELLASIAIIGMLIGLTLPAIQKVRATADRIRCSNQIRQLTLAVIRYHDERGALPMGVMPMQKKYDCPYMTWMTRLLPFSEQNVLWQQALTDYRGQRNPFFRPLIKTLPHRFLFSPVRPTRADPVRITLIVAGALPLAVTLAFLVRITLLTTGCCTAHLQLVSATSPTAQLTLC